MTTGSSRGDTIDAAARAVIPGGVNSVNRWIGPPYAFTGADGAHLIDADGRRYVDYHAAFGAILLGHNHPAVDEAVIAAIRGVDLPGFGGVFALYFMEGPIKGYRDLLRNDNAAYVAFHRRMTDAGFLMLPVALKRNHISGAHTARDVDRTLEAARDVLHRMHKDGIARS